MVRQKQKRDREKRIKKNKILLEEKENSYTKKDLWIKFGLIFVAASFGVGLFYFLLNLLSSGNTIIENIGMLFEGVLFLIASIYMVSVLGMIFRRKYKAFFISLAIILLMYYISQLFSIFLLITLDSEYIAYMIVNNHTKLFVLKNVLFNLHKNFITMVSISGLTSVFNVVYSSFYIASFLSPFLIFSKKLNH